MAEQCTDQEKTGKGNWKGSWNLFSHRWQYWMASNINNSQDFGHAQNLFDNLKT